MPKDSRDDWTARLNPITSSITPVSDAEFADGLCVSWSRSKSLYGFTIRGPYERDGETRHDYKSIEFYDVECEGTNEKLTVITGARKIWELEIAGLELLVLQDWFREHRCNWIRVAIGNQAKFPPKQKPVGETPEPFIQSIKLTDVTKRFRED